MLAEIPRPALAFVMSASATASRAPWGSALSSHLPGRDLFILLEAPNAAPDPAELDNKFLLLLSLVLSAFRLHPFRNEDRLGILDSTLRDRDRDFTSPSRSCLLEFFLDPDRSRRPN
jgi:hypothetical protein